MRNYWKVVALFLAMTYVITEPAQAQTCCPEFTFSDQLGLFPCSALDRCSGNSGGAGPNLFACKQQTIRYQAFPQLPGFTYTWQVTGGTPTTSTGNPLMVTWGNGSTGSITLFVSDASGNCRDTIVQEYCLLPTPVSSFSFSPASSACALTPIYFTNNSTGANNYYWDFGDGTIASLANPTHSYASPGIYTVTLQAFNVNNGERCGCTAVSSQTITVNSGTTLTIESSCKRMLCPGDTASYCVQNGCPPYNWTVNGGTIVGPSNQACVTVQWNNPPAVYPTSVSVQTGNCPGLCNNSATLDVPVLYPSIPINGNTTVCTNSVHTYSLPVLPGTFYSWSIGSGGVISGAIDSNTTQFNVLWNGVAGSSHQVLVNYSNPISGCSGSSALTVTMQPPFSLTGFSPICVGSNAFVSVSNGGAANWTVTPATGLSPAPPYTNTPAVSPLMNTIGTYVFQATPVIAANYCTNSATFPIVVNDTPTIQPIIGATSVCVGGTSVYSTTSNLSGGNFQWTVSAGGQIISTMGAYADSVVVLWNTPGPHTISVLQTVNGCSSSPQNLAINTVGPPQITSGPINACVDQTFTYTAAAGLPAGSYNWYIQPVNAGTIVSGQGTNTISVLWHGSTLSSTLIDTLYVQTCGGLDSLVVTVGSPPAAGINTSGNLCTGITLSSTISGVAYQWYLNGSLIPGATNSSYSTSTPGEYWLYVYQVPGGCPSRATILIPPQQKPYLVVPCGAGITDSIIGGTSIKFCSSAAISATFNVVTPGGSYSFQWYQNTYSNPVGTNSPTYTATQMGTYFVVVTDLSGPCVDTLGIVQVDTICCDPTYTLTFNANGCDTIGFKASITPTPSPAFPYAWCFGDGASASTLVDTVAHKYKYAGQYTACVYTRVISTGGDTCAVSGCRQVDVPLVADFDTVVTCNQVKLLDLSTAMPAYSPYSYSWSTSGPGTFIPSNTFSNPSVTFTASGTYTITLTISANGCTSTITKSVTVWVAQASILGPSTVCAGTNAPFSASPQAPLFQYAWDFGDNSTSFIANTSHQYPSPPPNNYAITLTITDTKGCSDIDTLNITVIPPLPLSISPDTSICPGTTVVLQATPGFQTYQWYRNGIAVPSSNSATLSVSNIGQYWVVATANNGGCSSTSAICQVFYKTIPIAHIVSSGIACIVGTNPASVFLYNDPNLPNYTYNWVYEGQITSLSTNYFLNDNPTVAGNYSYVVTVTDTSGCSVSDTICVIVGTAPTVTANALTPGNLCAGTVYSFQASASPVNPAYQYLWSNGQSTTTMSTGQPGNYTVLVTDPATGCTGTGGPFTIGRRPFAGLFPVGCDSLCDTSMIVPPLQLGGAATYASYTIEWFLNGNFGSPIYVGSPFPMSLLPPGNQQLQMVVTLGNCSDTSNVYDIVKKNCSLLLASSPVELQAQERSGRSLISWQIQEPSLYRSWQLERSTDGRRFTRWQDGRGMAQGEYWDDLPISNRLFYRLAALRWTNSWTYSAIRWVDAREAKSFRVYPNPVTQHQLTIQVTDSRSNYRVRVWSSTGQLLHEQALRVGINRFNTSSWIRGQVHVQVLDREGRSYVHPVLIGW